MRQLTGCVDALAKFSDEHNDFESWMKVTEDKLSDIQATPLDNYSLPENIEQLKVNSVV